MRGGPNTSSSSSSETISGSGFGTTMRALQCGQRPDFPANSLFTCSACPFGQVTLIDIHHLGQKNPQSGPGLDGAILGQSREATDRITPNSASVNALAKPLFRRRKSISLVAKNSALRKIRQANR